MKDFIQKRFPALILRDLIIDLEDRLRAEALKAFNMVHEHSGLDRRRARHAEGISRFHMMEKGFQEVCELHGGVLLEGGIVPNTDLKTYQPYIRFEVDGKGVILGLAAMAEPGKLPTKNKSRRAAIKLNYLLSPRFDFDGNGAKVGDICIILLFSRDREAAGKIEELAIGVIDTEYQHYLYYERLDEYLAGEEVIVPSPDGPLPNRALGGSVQLKAAIRKFVPPETPSLDDAESSNE